MYYLSVLLLVFSMFLSGCGGGDCGGDCGEPEPNNNLIINGVIVDGYIADATIFIDLNNNYNLDQNEPQTKSDQNGKFSFIIDKTKIPYPVTIVGYGGVDKTTGNSFNQKLSYISHKLGETNLVLSPLTTLVSLMERHPTDPATQNEALANLANFFGININDILKDPVTSFETNPAIYRANLKAASIVRMITSYANEEQTPQSLLSSYNALADYILRGKSLDDMTEVTRNDKTIDLGNSVEKIVNQIDAITTLPKDGEGYGSELEKIINNTPPSATFKQFSMVKDTIFNGTLTATDIDNNTLTFIKVTNPSNGSLTIDATNGLFTYEPTAGYVGVDSFSYKVNDGQIDSIVQTVSITVNASGIQNSAPVPTFTSFSVNENTTYNGNLTATDADNDTLTYIKVTSPTHGTLTVNANGSFTYVPTANYSGTDSFTYKVNDGKVDSAVQTVTITINASGIQNSAPVPTFTNFSMNEDSTYNGTLTATDADNDTLTFAKATNPNHGTLTINANGSFTYTPTAAYTGTDSFGYKANDGKVDSAVQTVSITVNASGVQNSAPVPTFGSFSLNEDSTYNGTLTATDADNDTLTFIKVNNSNHGTLTINADGSFTYQPQADFSGTDSFSYKVNDGKMDSEVKLVNITIVPVNDIPYATFDYFKTMEDQAFNGTLTASDADNDTLTFVKISNPANGTLDLQVNGSFTYTPQPNFNGTDAFSYRVNDGTVNSATQEVNITVSNVNETPIATYDSFDIDEDVLYTGTLTAADGDNDPLTYTKVTDASHGTLVINTNGTFTYISSADYNGTDSFSYKVNDGLIDSAIKEVNITINPVNDAPIATFTVFATPENTEYNGTLTAADADNDTLTFIKVSNPGHGTLSFEQNGSFIYAPSSNYSGTDTFSYKVNDGIVDSGVKTVNITISNVNHPPTPTYNNFNINEDNNYTDTLSGYDIDGDPITYSKVSNPSHGTLTVASNGLFTYSPTPNYSGLDSFTYQINDGYVNSEVHQVSIVVYSVNDKPVATFSSFVMTKDNDYNGTLTATDADNDTLTFILEQNATHAADFNLSESNGIFMYNPTGAYEGNASFTYKVYDGTQYSDIQEVNIVINDIPVVADGTFSVDENTEYNGTLTKADDIHTAYTFSKTAGPNHGVLTLDSNGSFTYTPTTNYSGTDQFTYKVNDGYLDSAEHNYTITINAHDNVPIATFSTFTVNEDSEYNGTLTADDDNSTLYYYWVMTSSHGTIDNNDTNGSFRYTPDGNYSGTDGFQYKVYDGTHYSAVKDVNITITAINDAPIASNGTLTVTEGDSNSSTVTAVDAENSPLTFSITTGPVHGAATMETNGSYTYTPANDYNGSDSFQFKANDGALDSEIKTVSITVTNINDTPVPTYDSFSTYENTTYKGILTATDADDDNLTYSIVLNPGHGVVTTTNDGNFTYTPAVDYNGTDSFTYKVNDGTVDSTEKRVNITVAASNGIKIAANDSHVSIIKNDGTLWSWGFNENGELGDSTNVDKNSPVQIGIDDNWTMISAGHTHTLAVKDNCTLWSWGLNTDGQLGDGTNTARNAPVQVNIGTSWLSIAAGNSHTLTIEGNGSLWAWGFNNNGQLGDGTTTSTNTPKQIGTDTNWTQITAGNHHTVADNNNTAWAWGNNQYGQLGDGTIVDSHTPKQIGIDQNWTKVASGYYHSAALKNGKLYTWGNNDYGQLGDNNASTDSTIPLEIESGSMWNDIAAGGSHSLAIKSDGTLWAWGYNSFGQLGDGTTTDRHTPKQIGTDIDWIEIDAGEFFTIAVKNDGTIWTWGKNDDGQLGDGTNDNKSEPTQIMRDNF